MKMRTCLSLHGTIQRAVVSRLRQGACLSFTARFRSRFVLILLTARRRADLRSLTSDLCPPSSVLLWLAVALAKAAVLFANRRSRRGDSFQASQASARYD